MLSPASSESEIFSGFKQACVCVLQQGDLEDTAGFRSFLPTVFFEVVLGWFHKLLIIIETPRGEMLCGPRD